jgi:tetratricopeptide (TPR) repeat protein
MARSKLERAVDLTKDEEYLSALTLFLDVFGTEDAPPLNVAKAASGLSYFGLCLALVSRKYKVAIELCKRAIDLEFYHGEHYANLARVYVAAGNRKKALETAEAGMKVAPEDDELRRARSQLGIRARPAVPFLDRRNPINVSLGQARYAKKLAESPKRKKN